MLTDGSVPRRDLGGQLCSATEAPLTLIYDSVTDGLMDEGTAMERGVILVRGDGRGRGPGPSSRSQRC